MKKYIPILSICIPTRNRPNELYNLINSLNNQIKLGNYISEVEVIISDNTDNDDYKIDKTKIDFNFVKYHTNNDDIGYAGNVNKVISLASGEYVWLLSDDDPLNHNALSSIMKTLNSNKKINYLTFDVENYSTGERVSNWYFGELDKDYFKSGQSFLNIRKNWQSVIFISINIFHRKKMMNYIQENNLYVKINDTFQSGLLSIGYINKYGCVQIIKKCLLHEDKNEGKYYTINGYFKTIRDYLKLNKQLKLVGAPITFLKDHLAQVNGKIIGHSIRSIVSNEIYATALPIDSLKKIIFKDNSPFSTKTKATIFYFIMLTISLNKKFGKSIFNLLLILKGNPSLILVTEELKKWNDNSSIMHESSY